MGFQRIAVAPGSFGAWSRQLPLLPEGSPVLLFNGDHKHRQDVHAAVLDLSVGKKDLQQCADAVMRLKAEHLYANGRGKEIRFHFTNGFLADYARWRQGERILVNGGHCRWVRSARPSDSHADLMSYLEQVFMYAGTLSLARELTAVGDAPMAPGDVFIQGGRPGHAVIVLDVARNADGREVFLLAQSYMPAQQVHVLKNLAHPELGAWFERRTDRPLRTPEWDFQPADLGR